MTKYPKRRSIHEKEAIWKKSLPHGGEVRIEKVWLPDELRTEREYTIIIVKPNGHRLGVCTVGENGIPKVWYDMPYDRKAIEEAIVDLPEILLIEQIHMS